ncbi:MAG: CBS domain-containing protein [Actinomycetia bacterium]|nr:CBS domain-containing protein [Actinomycetes bacterium]
MSGGIRLGRPLGVPLVADGSVFILVALFAVAVLVDLSTADVSGSSAARGGVAAGAGLLVILSILVHELSHVVMAKRRGLPVRSTRLYMFGGYSVIAGEPSALDEFEVAAVGPIVSIGLGGVFAAAAWFAGDVSLVGRAAWLLMIANVAIGLFNLIPGFPLDGARVLRGVLTTDIRDRVAATRLVTSVGRVVGWATIGAGLVLFVRRQPYGVFLIAGGWFLAQTATSSGRREELSAAFDGVTVADVMRSTPEAVSGDWTVSTLLNLHALGPDLRSLPVEVDGRIVGVIGQDEIDTVAPSRWPSARVKSLMVKIGPTDVVESEEPLETLLLRPDRADLRAVVEREGEVVGIVDPSALDGALGSS